MAKAFTRTVVCVAVAMNSISLVLNGLVPVVQACTVPDCYEYSDVGDGYNACSHFYPSQANNSWHSAADLDGDPTLVTDTTVDVKDCGCYPGCGGNPPAGLPQQMQTSFGCGNAVAIQRYICQGNS